MSASPARRLEARHPHETEGDSDSLAQLDALAERVTWLERRLGPPGWYTPAAAAHYTGLKLKRIYSLKSARELMPDGYDGRTPLWRRETLDAYLTRGS